MSSENETPRPFLRTDRGKFLDSRVFLENLVRVVVTSPPKPSEKGENDAVHAQVEEILRGELATERGIHIETLLTALGAIAGFSCQMALREALVYSGKMPEDKVFTIVGCADGETFFTGENINEGLLQAREGNFSVWSLVAGAPHSVGAPLPDINSMIQVMAKAYGTPEFWIPNLPAMHVPMLPPKELLDRYWNIVRNIQMMNIGTMSTMPFSMAHLAQRIILQNPTILDPTVGALIVMEAALRMSRINPGHIYFARFQSPV